MPYFFERLVTSGDLHLVPFVVIFVGLVLVVRFVLFFVPFVLLCNFCAVAEVFWV